MSAQARPQDYARAIYELALEGWTAQLGDIQRALKADPALRAAVADVSTPVGERLARLEAARRGGLGGDVRRFLGTLLEAGGLDQLDAILLELERLARRGPERRVAYVSSAVPLTPVEKEALRVKLAARFGPDLDFQFNVDKELLGGILLRVGDQVIDGTVAGKLAALRGRLTS